MVVAFLLGVLALVVLVGCLQHAKAEGWKAAGWRSITPHRRPTALPLQPAADRPPPNLPPLIPSPRVIARECERGLRELTFYLAGQPEQ